MSKYRVKAEMVTYLILDVEAESAEEAEEIAEGVDGGDWIEDPNNKNGGWEMEVGVTKLTSDYDS
jgi:hypothetical protein